MKLESIERELNDRFLEIVDNSPEPECRATLKDPNNKYRVISCMQKAIRRGHADLAKRCALATINAGQTDYMFRRLVVTAIEDICFGDIEGAAIAYMVLGKKAMRAKLGDARVTAALIDHMAKQRKCRAANNMSVAYAFGPDKMELKQWAVEAESDELANVFVNATDRARRVIAGRALGGSLTMGNKKERAYAKSSRPLYMESVKAITDNYNLRYLAYKGFSHGGELSGLATCMVLAADDYYNAAPDDIKVVDHAFPEPEIIGRIADYSYDKHTREGMRAIAYLSKHSEPINEFCNAHGVSAFDFISQYVFIVEGSLVSPELVYSADVATMREAHLEQTRLVGLPDESLETGIEIMRAELPALNAARRRIME